MAKCAACGKFMTTKDGAKCAKCFLIHHQACVGLPENATVALTWICPDCKTKLPKQNNATTPVRGLQADCLKECLTDKTSKSEELNVRESELAREIRVFREELREMRLEIQEFKHEVTEIMSTINICNKRIDQLDARVGDLERRYNAIPELEATISQLKCDINDRDQELLLTEVDIAGIPEVKGENLVNIVSLTAKKLGVSLDEHDIVNVVRVGSFRAYSESPNGRPRPIALRLARRVIRDELIQAARVRRGATTADMDIPGTPRAFYINERLTKTNRLLFNKARELVSLHKWRFVWTREGRVYVRREQGLPWDRIRNETDLCRVFGPVNVRSDKN